MHPPMTLYTNKLQMWINIAICFAPYHVLISHGKNIFIKNSNYDWRIQNWSKSIHLLMPLQKLLYDDRECGKASTSHTCSLWTTYNHTNIGNISKCHCETQVENRFIKQATLRVSILRLPVHYLAWLLFLFSFYINFCFILTAYNAQLSSAMREELNKKEQET